MGEETSKPAAPETAVTEEVVVEAAAPPPQPQPQPEPEPECEKKPEPDPDAAADASAEKSKEEVKEGEKVEEKKDKAAAEEEVKEKITESASFKEETNVVGDLPESQKKALEELKTLVQEALNKREFYTPPPPPPTKEEEKKEEEVKVEVVEEEKKKEEAKPDTEETSKQAEQTEPCKEEAADKPEPEPAVEKTTPPPPPPAAAAAETETAVVEVEKVAEKAAGVDDDGAVTVEAIKETIVEVSTKTEESPAAPVVEAQPKKAEGEEAAKEEVKQEEEVVPEEVFIYGIPLLGEDKSDVILLKFLRAREFKVKEAFNMIKNTVRWRKEFDIDAVLEEELGSHLEKAVFMHGLDKEGHPVCYNAYGEFQNKELYQACFTDDEKRKKFLKWRIQFLEKSVRKLDYSPTGICTIVHVNDMKNLPGLFQRDLRQSINKALQLLQDNYPEFVAKQVCINVPWWYLVYHKMISPFLTQRTKSKFVFATPARSVDTLFKYIAPEHVPVQYGGLSREGEQEFSVADSATEVTVKPASKHTVEFPVTEACVVVWEARVLGWDVCYGAEFVPSSEGAYTVIVHKSRKIASSTDEPIVSGSFKISEPGKVVLTFDNQTSKKKKLLYRSKTKSSTGVESLIDC